MNELFELEWLGRLLAAMAAGMLIGHERRNRAKEAGIRTHTMVAMSSCLLMIISKYGFADVGAGDPARIAAQVVSGVGFLGAGVIFVRHDVIQGLTTAAGIWSVSAIGLCFGAGMYIMAAVTTLLVYLVQHIFRMMVPRNHQTVGLKLKIALDKDININSVIEVINKHHFHQSGENKFSSDGKDGYVLVCDVVTISGGDPLALIKDLKTADGVVSAEIV